MSSIVDKLTDKSSMDFIAKVEEPFTSLPKLPDGIVEFFVKFVPYLALLGAILSIIGAPLVLLGSLASLVFLAPQTSLVLLISAVLSIVNAVLLFMAFKPLKEREMKGWVLIFWTNVISFVSSLTTILNGNVAGVVMALISAAIGFYVLFQMKRFYGKLIK